VCQVDGMISHGDKQMVDAWMHVGVRQHSKPSVQNSENASVPSMQIHRLYDFSALRSLRAQQLQVHLRFPPAMLQLPQHLG